MKSLFPRSLSRHLDPQALKRFLMAAGAIGFGLAAATPAGAATVEPLYSFGYTTNSTGSNPNTTLVPGGDGFLYGTTPAGGTNGYGTIYRVDPAGALTTMVNFDSTNGSSPHAPLVRGADGCFYGTTLYGGFADDANPGGYGTVFKLSTNGVLTLLGLFDGTNGASPTMPLVEAPDGNFYGTTYYGGTNSQGSVFKVSPSGGLTLLFTFAYTNGGSPDAGLTVGPDGCLYGSTYYGGNSGVGTLFRITTNGVFTLLHSFGITNGVSPDQPMVVGGDGNLYGTTPSGGGNYCGTVFRLGTNGTVTTLVNFAYSVSGATPNAPLLPCADGALLGTAAGGGTNNSGTIFRVTTNGAVSVLRHLSLADGGSPRAPLMLGPNGEWYGTTVSGGPFSLGGIYRINGNGTMTSLAWFDGTNGGYSSSSFVLGPDGCLYSTCSTGGPRAGGTLFKVTPSDVLIPLASFYEAVATDGSSPGAPVPGAGNSFYGIAGGGAFGNGTVFRIDTNGLIQTLHAFQGGADGSYDRATVIPGSDGNLYGTTVNGGASGAGTVFRIDSRGSYSLLYTFTGGAGGGALAGLVQAKDGNFYGTTEEGGAYSGGTLVRLTPSGVCTLLHSFLPSSEGSHPNPLVQARDGNLYGTTLNSGSNNMGAAFKFSLSGAFTVLASFQQNLGSHPAGPLVQGPDGFLYGKTTLGAAFNYGALFKLGTNGALTWLHGFQGGLDATGDSLPLAVGADGRIYGTSFSGGTNSFGIIYRFTTADDYRALYQFTGQADGGYPSGLALGKDHRLYGTAFGGGARGAGIFFRLDAALAPSILAQPAPTTNQIGTAAAFTVESDGALPLSYHWFKDSVSLQDDGNISGTAAATLTIAHASLTNAGSYFVVVSNRFGTAVSSNAALVVLPPLAIALNATNLTWTTGGDVDWFGQLGTSHDGLHSGQSGMIFDWETSWAATSVEGPGQVAFWWKVSSEPDYDSLTFYVNDEPQTAISGETGWAQRVIDVGPGPQTLLWAYEKDSTVSLGQDCAWLDEVAFTPVLPQPEFQPATIVGGKLNLSWTAIPGRTYQLQYNTNLTQTNWIDLGSSILATNSLILSTNTIGPDPQRFYRTRLMQ